MPLAERLAAALAVRVLALATVAHLRVLAGRAGLTGERRLVNLELDSLDEADVGGNAVSDRERDEVSGQKRVGERGMRAAVADQVAVVGDKLVQRFKRLF